MQRPTSLIGLPQKKVTTGLLKLKNAGITPALWLRMLNADATAMQCLRKAWPGACLADGLVYDAVAMARILGLPVECNEAAPKAAPGEIVLWYGGWSLKTLRDSAAGKQWMDQSPDQEQYDVPGWTEKPGYYHLHLPLWGSQGKTYAGHYAFLRKERLINEWELSPVAIAATALLVLFMETGDDPLQYGACRCGEPLPHEFAARSALMITEGRLHVGTGQDDRTEADGRKLWIAACSRGFF